jgi:hypothetical protein
MTRGMTQGVECFKALSSNPSTIKKEGRKGGREGEREGGKEGRKEGREGGKEGRRKEEGREKKERRKERKFCPGSVYEKAMPVSGTWRCLLEVGMYG